MNLKAPFLDLKKFPRTSCSERTFTDLRSKALIETSDMFTFCFSGSEVWKYLSRLELNER